MSQIRYQAALVAPVYCMKQHYYIVHKFIVILMFDDKHNPSGPRWMKNKNIATSHIYIINERNSYFIKVEVTDL